MVFTPIGAIGDIIRLVEISYTVAQALRIACTSAPKEVEALADDVVTIHNILRLTNTTLDSHGGSIRNLEDVKTEITNVFGRCWSALQEIDSIVNKYTLITQRDSGSLSGGRWGSRDAWAEAFKVGYMRVRWTTMEGAIDHIRKRLNQQCQALDLIIKSLQM